MRKVMLGMLLGLLALSAPAFGAFVIDFGTGSVGSGGTVSCSGGQCTGSGIPLDSMVVLGTATADGTYDLYGTGTGATPEANGSAVLAFNTSTGAITITGGVCILGNTTCTGGANTFLTSRVLLNGTGSASILNLTAGSVAVSLTYTEPDTKNGDLLFKLGIPGTTSFALMNFTLNGANTAGTGSPYTATSTDIQNIGTVVPEPTSILLLGTVLVGVTQLIRRRTKKA